MSDLEKEALRRLNLENGFLCEEVMNLRRQNHELLLKLSEYTTCVETCPCKGEKTCQKIAVNAKAQ